MPWRDGHVVVGYESGSHAYDAAVPRLRAGACIAILPEAGGVSRSFRVRECNTGAVLMAGVPVSLRLGRPAWRNGKAWMRPKARGAQAAGADKPGHRDRLD